MQPHETKKTLSLNEARNYIIAMSKPMGEAVELIEMNVKKINEVKEQCRLFDVDIERFQAELKFKGFDRVVTHLHYPMTVCADTACKKYVNVGMSRERETIYPQICHDHCSIRGVPVETTNNEQLHGCAAMSNGTCHHCGHNYRTHMHITYSTTLVEKEFLSSDAQSKIAEKTNLKDQKESFIANLERSIKELQEEKEFIYECAGRFGVFLKENAMIPYNDSFKEYLDMLIRDEEAREQEIRDDEKIAQLKKDKKTYEQKKKIIMENIQSGCQGGENLISIEAIYKMKEKLCRLKHNGEALRKALGTL